MKRQQLAAACLVIIGSLASEARATFISDPNDSRTWQGASVGTFAALYYGSDTPANRQLVVDNQLLDDGVFDPTGYTAATLLPNDWSNGVSGGSHLGGNSRGYSTGTTVGDYSYVIDNSISVFTAGNGIDNKWFQSSGTIGDTVYDLGALSSKAAIFNTVDHGPLPQEAIESTVYLSNDLVNWTLAVTERVWLEGFDSNLGVQWDGFVYAVGTGTTAKFRYASIIHGGPGALIDDGDNEINGVLGLNDKFQPPNPVPLPGGLVLASMGILSLLAGRRRLQGRT